MSLAKDDLVLQIYQIDDKWSEGINLTASLEGKYPHSHIKPDLNCKYVSLYTFQGNCEEDLSFEEDEEIWLIQQLDENWAQGTKIDQEGNVFFGTIPLNYVRPSQSLFFEPSRLLH